MKNKSFKFLAFLILTIVLSCEKDLETDNPSINMENRIVIACGKPSSSDNYYVYAIDGNGNLLWSKPGFGPPVAINNDIAYLNLSGNLYAVNVRTGEEIWSNETTQGDFNNSITFYNKVLYTSSFGSKKIYAVNALTGEIKWSFETDILAVFSSAPTVVNEVVYFGAPDENVYALDLEGNLIWKYFTNAGDLRSSTAVSDNKLYIGADNGSLYVLNAENGDSIWSYNIGITGEESPTISNHMVFIQGEQKVFCLNSDNGSIIWDYDIAYSYSWSSPTEIDGKLYVCGINRGLQALNSNDGSELWNNTSFGTTTRGCPVVFGEVVYVSAPGGLVAIDALTGNTLWNYGEFTFMSTAISFYSSPVVYDTETKLVGYPSDSGNMQ